MFNVNEAVFSEKTSLTGLEFLTPETTSEDLKKSLQESGVQFVPFDGRSGDIIVLDPKKRYSTSTFKGKPMMYLAASLYRNEEWIPVDVPVPALRRLPVEEEIELIHIEDNVLGWEIVHLHNDWLRAERLWAIGQFEIVSVLPLHKYGFDSKARKLLKEEKYWLAQTCFMINRAE